ncbi:hypothetical protein ADICEAN_00896 [Cesiribacter andamanensis AMV16]|uniref:Uncharacterized protein n=2 Tax=Cesiribacter TaxID=1133570 RepID=M7NZY4_9BACT|nr:hypothetical protein ADICEAN_00896 [Cesiribacter andamanensis AMV16]
MLETVCRHILDDLGVLHEQELPLERLYALATACLQLSGAHPPHQPTLRLLQPAFVSFASGQQGGLIAAGQAHAAYKGWDQGLVLQAPMDQEAGRLADYLLRKHLENKGALSLQ